MARALRLRPDEPRLADEVERLGEAAGDPRRAADTFEAALDGARRAPAKPARELGLRTARLWEKLGQSDRAEARYLYVLEVDGENGDALEALERIYRGRGDHAELASILGRRAGIEFDVAQKKQLYAEAAELHERALGDVTGRDRRLAQGARRRRQRRGARSTRWRGCTSARGTGRSW